MTPTQSDGSPGVMVTKTPSSCACCRVELSSVKSDRQAADRNVNVQLNEQVLLAERQQLWRWMHAVGSVGALRGPSGAVKSQERRGTICAGRHLANKWVA